MATERCKRGETVDFRQDLWVRPFVAKPGPAPPFAIFDAMLPYRAPEKASAAGWEDGEDLGRGERGVS